MKSIKGEVLEELQNKFKDFMKREPKSTPRFIVGTPIVWEEVEKAISLTLQKVQKIIDEVYFGQFITQEELLEYIKRKLKEK